MTIFGSFFVQTPEIWFPKTKFIRWPNQSFRMCWYRFPWSIWCPRTRFQYWFDDRTTSDGPMDSPKKFSHTENTEKWPYLAPKGLVRKYTKNPCFLRSLRLLDVPIIFWNVMISFSSIYLMYLNTIDLIVFRDIQLIKENDIKIWSGHPTTSKIVKTWGFGVFPY